MNTNQFTQKTMEALQAAQRLAIEYSNQALEQEHMLVALTQQQDGLIPQLLTKMNVDPGTFEAAAAEKVSQLPHVTGSGRDPDKVYISNELDQALTAAEKQAQQMKDQRGACLYGHAAAPRPRGWRAVQAVWHHTGKVHAGVVRRARQPARDH